MIRGGEFKAQEVSSAAALKNQLITAAPLESSTLRWTPPRERAGYVNLKAPRTSYGPRGGRVARREKRELERPRIVQNLGEGYPILRRTRTDFFQATTSHCRPCTKRGLPWGASYHGNGRATPGVGHKRSLAPKNAPRSSVRANAAPRQSASGGKGGRLCEG